MYASAQVADCIIPTTVRHMCCTTGVYPWNKRITKPPTLRPSPSAGRGVVVKGGSGVTVVKDQEAHADLPIDVEIMCFDARRDLDERGRQAFGVDERQDVVDGEWIFAGASLDGVVGDLCAAPAAIPGPGVAPVPRARGATPDDAFGERHYYGDGDDDADVDETMGDGCHEGESMFSGWT